MLTVRMHSPVFGPSGFEVLGRGLAIALDKLGVVVSLDPSLEWNIEKNVLDEETMSRLTKMCKQVVRKDSPEIIYQVPRKQYLSPKRYVFSLYETDRCPENWIKKFEEINEVWTFSDFNLNGWEGNGFNVDKIPFGADTFNYFPKNRDKDDFVFLSSGDFTPRKNFELLIEAYLKEFTDKDNVKLIIKAHFGGFVRSYQDRCIEKFKTTIKQFWKHNSAPIYFLGKKISQNDIPKFYHLGDCFVLPSYGEGLCLPMVEALASGIPVISSKWGGQMEFLTDRNSYLVDGKVDRINSVEYIRLCPDVLNHKWFYPDLDSLQKQMRLAYEDRKLSKEKGQQGRVDMEGRNWQDAGLKIIGKLLKN